jgi:molybdopterin molybdotransferase
MQHSQISARLLAPLSANETRQDYMRARLVVRDGEFWTEAFPLQDSAMLTTLAHADALIVRPPGAGPAQTGDRVGVLLLADC